MPSIQDFDSRLQVLDETGELVNADAMPDLEDEELVEMYRLMRLGRHFDERAVSLQRQGRMGTYPPLSGQEGAQVGSAMALDHEDWLFPSYREHIALHQRGLPLEHILQYWRGDERGNAIPEDANIFTLAVPIATQIPHATGAAWASKMQDEERAFLCYFGDGATSEGDFHEGVNFGGVFDVPCIYFCNNNQWAISVPRERQTVSETLSQKATAYGFDGVQVDGMDPLAVYTITRAAVEKAKSPSDGERRPTLIEAVQYRYGAHTTADDPSVYRDKDEVQKWKQRDPIRRLETFLLNQGILDEPQIADIESTVESEVDDVIEAVESASDPDPRDMFENVYATMPDRLEEQLQYLDRLRDTHGDGALLEDNH